MAHFNRAPTAQTIRSQKTSTGQGWFTKPDEIKRGETAPSEKGKREKMNFTIGANNTNNTSATVVESLNAAALSSGFPLSNTANLREAIGKFKNSPYYSSVINQQNQRKHQQQQQQQLSYEIQQQFISSKQQHMEEISRIYQNSSNASSLHYSHKVGQNKDSIKISNNFDPYSQPSGSTQLRGGIKLPQRPATSNDAQAVGRRQHYQNSQQQMRSTNVEGFVKPMTPNGRIQRNNINQTKPFYEQNRFAEIKSSQVRGIDQQPSFKFYDSQNFMHTPQQTSFQGAHYVGNESLVPINRGGGSAKRQGEQIQGKKNQCDPIQLGTLRKPASAQVSYSRGVQNSRNKIQPQPKGWDQNMPQEGGIILGGESSEMSDSNTPKIIVTGNKQPQTHKIEYLDNSFTKRNSPIVEGKKQRKKNREQQQQKPQQNERRMKEEEYLDDKEDIENKKSDDYREQYDNGEENNYKKGSKKNQLDQKQEEQQQNSKNNNELNYSDNLFQDDENYEEDDAFHQNKISHHNNQSDENEEEGDDGNEAGEENDGDEEDQDEESESNEQHQLERGQHQQRDRNNNENQEDDEAQRKPYNYYAVPYDDDDDDNEEEEEEEEDNDDDENENENEEDQEDQDGDQNAKMYGSDDEENDGQQEQQQQKQQNKQQQQQEEDEDEFIKNDDDDSNEQEEDQFAEQHIRRFMPQQIIPRSNRPMTTEGGRRQRRVDGNDELIINTSPSQLLFSQSQQQQNQNEENPLFKQEQQDEDNCDDIQQDDENYEDEKQSQEEGSDFKIEFDPQNFQKRIQQRPPERGKLTEGRQPIKLSHNLILKEDVRMQDQFTTKRPPSRQRLPGRGAGLGIPTSDLQDIPIKNMYEKGDEDISEKNRNFFEANKLKIEKINQMQDGEEGFFNFDFRNFGECGSRKNSQRKALPPPQIFEERPPSGNMKSRALHSATNANKREIGDDSLNLKQSSNLSNVQNLKLSSVPSSAKNSSNTQGNKNQQKENDKMFWDDLDGLLNDKSSYSQQQQQQQQQQNKSIVRRLEGSDIVIKHNVSTVGTNSNSVTNSSAAVKLPFETNLGQDFLSLFANN